jgi:hypothetical protein
MQAEEIKELRRFIQEGPQRAQLPPPVKMPALPIEAPAKIEPKVKTPTVKEKVVSFVFCFRL